MRELDRRALFGALGAVVTAAPSGTMADNLGGWPLRPVRVVVPFAPGGPTDIYARLMAEHLGRTFGQPFVVENRAGATGSVGTMLVARAAPDGHTLLFPSSSSYVIAPLVLRDAGFDPLKDFLPVSLVANCPFYMLASPAMPVRSVAEFVAFARERPGRLNFSSPGVGSAGHFVAELFLHRAGIQAVHVPFNGAAPSVTAVAAGDVQFAFDTVGTAQPLVAEGRIRGLALTGARRMDVVAEVPTLAEAGFEGFDAALWVGLLAPVGTPSAIIEAMNAAIDRLLVTPEARARIAAAGYEPGGGPPGAMQRRILEETRVWGEVKRVAGIQAA